ncbi:hypothetical protein [Salinirubrum litoreum]|uniref:Uncharacterized protein n=1 Tax=Salinirubrum litoreum TaxID=1126234 RepID=A0ABD5RFA7_9EURY|nr:hypothetical protein [Salinirubrum litoreum]
MGDIIKMLTSGDYNIQVRADNHPLPGAPCIPYGGNVAHMNLELYKNGDSIFNLHIGEYNGGSGKCYIAWESEIPGFEFCLNSCQDRYNPSGASDWVSTALHEFNEEVQDFADESGDAVALAAVAGILAFGIKTLIDILIAAWLIPIVPPPP